MNKPDTDTNRTTRRTFIKTAATAGFTLAALPHLGCTHAGRRGAAPTAVPLAADMPDTFPDLRVACIGTGGIGGYHLENIVELGVQCPCYCDVDTAQYKRYAEQYPKARQYQDYRRMLDQEQNNIDAVMIGTPDHHHYPATIIAMQLGKHVYTQKPLTHTPWEARELTKAAARYRVATQMGNQGHAGEGWRLVYEWIHSGALGTIKEVHTWTDRPVWPQGIGRPEGEDPVPASLDWDVWLGPAPVRPFKKDVYHRFNWRGWWDFGAGALGDMACHTMDGMFWALDPGHPSAIESLSRTSVNDESFPKASIVRWEFPRRGWRAGFVAYWYDGGLMPTIPAELEFGRGLPSTGNLFIGTKASLLVSGDYGNSPRVFPETRMREIGKPPKLLERSPGHVKEWVMAAAGVAPLDYPKSNFAYAGPMSETILLGNVAVRVGRRLEWDGKRMEFTNVPEANRYVSKEYRAGWKF